MLATGTDRAPDLPEPLDTGGMARTGTLRTLIAWNARDAAFRRVRPAAGNLTGALNHFSTRLGYPLYGLLLRAHRYGAARFVEEDLVRAMPAIRSSVDDLLSDGDGFDRVCLRSIILKNPRLHGSTIEKGILLVTFSASFPFFRREVDVPLLLKYFSIVLEPSSAGYGTPEILFWLNYPEHPIVVEASEIADFRFLTRLEANLIPVSFGASDWVDHRRFRPLPGITKTYDSVYVANYKRLKRCHTYFRALATVKPKGFKAALVCDSWGGSRDEVLTLARYYGVGEILDLYEDLSQPELNVVLNHSKVILLLSLKEGSSRAIFEGFAAGVPGIVLRENIGVNKAYFNSQTGMLADENDLPEALLHFKSRWQDYDPRAWALNNISPEMTTAKLADCLRSLARERAEPWTDDPVPKINAPEVAYFNEADRQRFPNSAQVLTASLKSVTPEEKREAKMREFLRGGSNG